MINSKVILFTYYATLNHLMKKSDSKRHLIRWVFLLQQFDWYIRDKAKLENVMADHLLTLGPEATPTEELPLDDSFIDDQLFLLLTKPLHTMLIW